MARPRPLQFRGQSVRTRRRKPNLIEQFQNKMDEANAANETRYQDILSRSDQLRDRVMGDLSNVGQQQTADINRVYRNESSNVYNRLVGRGFGNSSLPSTQQQGVMREQQGAHNRLQDMLARTRAQFDTNITNQRLGVMERKFENAPDFNQLIQLATNMGQFNGGFGGGGGIGQRIGIGRDQYQNAYMGGLMQHLMMSGGNARGSGVRNGRQRSSLDNRQRRILLKR